MDYITPALSVTLLVLLAVSAVGLWYVIQLMLPLIHYGGPYVVSRSEHVDAMIRLAKLTPADRITDLGSGDGRIVIAAASEGVADALGIEINGALVKASEFSSHRLGLKNARFVRESFWKSNISDRTVVFLYQVPYAMRKLETKLQEELPPGARVISNDFKFVNWKPIEEHGRIRIYVKSEVA
ncbi:MAG: methyltransferase domain-containing protein [Candidatus Uhrbacteria bacterium]